MLLFNFSKIILFYNHYLLKIIKVAIEDYFFSNLGSMMMGMGIWGDSIYIRWILQGQWVIRRCRN